MAFKSSQSKVDFLQHNWYSEDAAQLGQPSQYSFHQKAGRHLNLMIPGTSNLKDLLQGCVDDLRMEIVQFRMPEIYSFIFPEPRTDPTCCRIRSPEADLPSETASSRNSATHVIPPSFPTVHLSCHPGQLFLCRTLQNQAKVDLGAMIRTIGVYCIILSGYRIVFETDLNKVIACAPSLTTIALNLPWPKPASVPKALDLISWPLTHVDLPLLELQSVWFYPARELLYSGTTQTS